MAEGAALLQFPYKYRTYKFGDVLAQIIPRDGLTDQSTPCHFIDDGEPFWMPRRNFLTGKLDVAFAGDAFESHPALGAPRQARDKNSPAHPEHYYDRAFGPGDKEDYIAAMRRGDVDVCRRACFCLGDDPTFIRVRGRTCMDTTRVGVRLSVAEFALFELFNDVNHTVLIDQYEFDWDKLHMPVVDLFRGTDPVEYTDQFGRHVVPGVRGLRSLEQMQGQLLDVKLSVGGLFVFLNSTWLAPRSGYVSNSGSQILCTDFSRPPDFDDSVLADYNEVADSGNHDAGGQDYNGTGANYGSSGYVGTDTHLREVTADKVEQYHKDPRLVNTSFGNLFFTYGGNDWSLLNQHTSPYADATFSEPQGVTSDNWNSIGWKKFSDGSVFYDAKTFNPVTNPIVTWTVIIEVWGRGPGADFYLTNPEFQCIPQPGDQQAPPLPRPDSGHSTTS